MARHDDLSPLAGGGCTRAIVPHHAEVALAIVVSGLILVADLRTAIGFSSFESCSTT